MTTTNLPEVPILQLAERQYNDMDLLVVETWLSGDDNLKKCLMDTSSSVVQCIAEGFGRDGTPEFQKNFLVIAKSFNTEFNAHLQQCARKACITTEKAEYLQAQNKALEDGIVATIRSLQQLTLQPGAEPAGNAASTQSINFFS